LQRLQNIFVTEDDGLATPVVGPWAKTKYKIIFDYMVQFSSGMKKLWNNRVFMDLYSAAGKARIRNTKTIVNTSSILALKVPDLFDQYIFCEKDPSLFNALKKRIHTEFSNENMMLVCGDCNEYVDKIINQIPTPSKGNTVLGFCFVDPNSLDIKFETVKKLSARFMDFLVLLALDMDARRNIKSYISENNTRISKFLGEENWRVKWEKEQKEGKNFVRFLADEFTQQMIRLGYRREAINNFIHIRSNTKNLPLYYLAFYSKHPTAYKFWKTVQLRNNEPGFFD
jgi:three-Cys-motif partner protein